MKYFKKIDGERLYLSPVNPDDFEIYTKWIHDPEVSNNIGSNDQNFSLIKERELLEEFAKDNTIFSIISKENDNIIGNISLFQIHNTNRHCEIGIFIGDPNYRNNGYGHEALRLLLDHGFNQLNMNSIMLRVFEYNVRAVKCYEKVGFKHAGRIRQNKYLNGEYHDTLIMDILKSEFV